MTWLFPELVRMDSDGFFQDPVDEEKAEAPGYNDVIGHPMDFATMRKELLTCHNVTWRNFVVRPLTNNSSHFAENTGGFRNRPTKRLVLEIRVNATCVGPQPDLEILPILGPLLNDPRLLIESDTGEKGR